MSKPSSRRRSPIVSAGSLSGSPSSRAIAAGSSSASRRAASSNQWTPSKRGARRAASSSASLVLPVPPGPVSVRRRAPPATSPTACSSSCSRPTKAVWGRGSVAGQTPPPSSGSTTSERPFEGGHELAAALVALAGLLRERPREDRVQPAEPPLRQRRRLVTNMREEERGLVLAHERRRPREHAIGEAGKRIEIRGPRRLPALDPLRRQIRRRPRQRARHRRPAKQHPSAPARNRRDSRSRPRPGARSPASRPDAATHARAPHRAPPPDRPATRALPAGSSGPVRPSEEPRSSPGT